MYFKKNLWQRIKFAFKTVLSDKPLEEMYTTGYKAGVDEVINDYRLLKEKLIPILKELATPPQKLDDNFITYPDMSVQQLSFFNVEHPVPRFLHNDIDSPYPIERTTVERVIYTAKQVQVTAMSDPMVKQLQGDARYAKYLEHEQHNAAQRLGEYLLKNGFIRATRLASTNPRDMKVMYWTLTYTKLQ